MAWGVPHASATSVYAMLVYAVYATLVYDVAGPVPV